MYMFLMMLKHTSLPLQHNFPFQNSFIFEHVGAFQSLSIFSSICLLTTIHKIIKHDYTTKSNNLTNCISFHSKKFV